MTVVEIWSNKTSLPSVFVVSARQLFHRYRTSVSIHLLLDRWAQRQEQFELHSEVTEENTEHDRSEWWAIKSYLMQGKTTFVNTLGHQSINPYTLLIVDLPKSALPLTLPLHTFLLLLDEIGTCKTIPVLSHEMSVRRNWPKFLMAGGGWSVGKVL